MSTYSRLGGLLTFPTCTHRVGTYSKWALFQGWLLNQKTCKYGTSLKLILFHFIGATGYEFDPGIHYIGEMECNGSMRLLSDQLTEGQLQWVPLEIQYDTVVIGDAENARRYPVCGGRQDDYRKALYKSFPKEKKAIDKYMDILKVSLYVFVIHVTCESHTGLASCGLISLTSSIFNDCRPHVSHRHLRIRGREIFY